MDKPKWTDVAIVVLKIVFLGVMRWMEMHEGGKDTHDLAVSAGKQEDAAKALADQAKAQSNTMSESLTKTDAIIQRATDQATATNRLAEQAKLSADIAGKSLAATEHSREVQERPWVGLEDNAIKLSPTVDFFWGIPPNTVQFPTITVSATYSVKNFGITPALHETDSIRAIAYHDGLKPIQDLTRFCELEEALSNGGAKTSGAGEMILPGARKQPSWATNLQLNPGQTHIERFWIFVCIAYQDSGSQIHHSRYMYLTRHRDLGSGPVVSVPGHPEWTYITITGANLDSAQAK